MAAIYDDARADALVAQGIQGLMERLGLCKEIMHVRAKLAEAITLRPVAAQERAKAMTQRRINALRALLLPNFKASSTSAAVDELLIPTTAKKTLMDFVEQANQGSDRDKISTSLVVNDLVEMLRRINAQELDLGLTNRSQSYLDIANAAQNLRPTNEPDTEPHMRGHIVFKPVVDAAIEAGKFTDEQLQMVKAAAQQVKEAKDASDLTIAPEEAAELNRLRGKFYEFKSQLEDLANAKNAIKAKRGMDNDEFKAAYQKYADLYAEYLEWHRGSYVKRGNVLIEAIKKKREVFVSQSADVHTKLMADINKDNPVSEQDAKDWVDRNLTITAAAVSRLRRIGYAPEQLRKDFVEFYRFARGRVDKLVIDTKGDRRANATGINTHGTAGSIFLDSSFDKVTLWHEAGHHIEADPVARAAAALYIRQRSEDGRQYTLRSLTGNRGYGPGEVALKGGFFSPYVGKIYRGGVTEVFSMGCETFANPALLATRMEKDPQTLEFVLGYLRSPKTAMQQLHQSMREAMREISEDAQENAQTVIQKRNEELAKSIQLENIDPTPWLEREKASWIVERHGGQYVGAVKSDSGDIFYVYSSKRVLNTDTRRFAAGYKVYVDDTSAGMYELQIPGKDKTAMLTVLAVWAKSNGNFMDAKTILSGRA